jgi:hypothetical protein
MTQFRCLRRFCGGAELLAVNHWCANVNSATGGFAPSEAQAMTSNEPQTDIESRKTHYYDLLNASPLVFASERL